MLGGMGGVRRVLEGETYTARLDALEGVLSSLRLPAEPISTAGDIGIGRRNGNGNALRPVVPAAHRRLRRPYLSLGHPSPRSTRMGENSRLNTQRR